MAAAKRGRFVFRGLPRGLSVIDTSVASRPVEFTGLCGHTAGADASRGGDLPGTVSFDPPPDASYMLVSTIVPLAGRGEHCARRPAVVDCGDVPPIAGVDPMLALERETGGIAASADTARFRMRLRTADAGEQIITVPVGKTTIGSSPRCNVRIEQPGVPPLHCLIVHESDGLSVRRWAAETRLNGEPFDEAALEAGDCLSVGSIELVIETTETPASQVEAMESCHEQSDASTYPVEPCDQGEKVATESVSAAVDNFTVWLNDDQRTPWIEEPGSPEQSSVADTELESYRWNRADKALVPFEAAKIVFRELQTATGIARGRSRKLLTALRQNRDDYRQLAERVANLECLMQAALFESENVGLLPHESVEGGSVESTIFTRSSDPSTELVDSATGRDSAAAELVAREMARLRDELSQLSEAKQRLDDEKHTLSAEIENLREQLAAAQQQVVKWKEAEADWQCGRAEWTNEREEWVRQRETLERQIANSEIQLLENLQRIETLEKELEGLRQSRAEPQNPFDWSALPQREPSDADRIAEVAVNQPAGEPSWDRPAWDAEPLPATSEVSVATDEKQASAAMTDESELAPFAEFSIWNQGAVTPSPAAEEESPAQHAPVTKSNQPDWSSEESTQAASRATPAESFIERYAHMFADDEASGEQPRSVASSEPAESETTVRKPRNMGLVRREAEPAPSGDEEESIEQYMAKLLQRVRGDGRRVTASQAPPTADVGESSTETAGALEPPSQPAAPKLAPLSPPARAPAADGKEHVTTSLGTVRRKVPLAEQSADLETFRALANESARRAISTHALRKHRRNAVTKVIVATLAGVTSLWLMLEAPHSRDLQFITACVSLTVAAYWAGQAYCTLLETLRAASYDGPDDGLKDLVEALRPQLPIDVEK